MDEFLKHAEGGDPRLVLRGALVPWREASAPELRAQVPERPKDWARDRAGRDDHPPIWWTRSLCRKRRDLSLQFKLNRALVAKVRMPPGGVVEHLEVVTHRRGRDGARRVALMLDELGFERCKEALGNG